jgi:hypothetical protein
LKLQNCLIFTHGVIKQALLLILLRRKEVLLHQGAGLLRAARRQEHTGKDNDTGKQQKTA